MEQRRQPSAIQWYHETQYSAHDAAPLTPEAAACDDVLWLGLTERLDSHLTSTLTAQDVLFHASRRCYNALFPSNVSPTVRVTLSLYDRLSAALAAAQTTGVQRLCSHYAARLTPLDGPDASRASNIRQTLITQYARQLAGQPTQVSAAASTQLIEAGFSQQDVITFTQIVGFISYQARLIAGVAALGAQPIALFPASTPFDDASGPLLTAEHIHWLPHISLRDPVNDTDSTHDHPLYPLLQLQCTTVLQDLATIARQILQNEALPEAWRELTLLVTARINGCAYRTALHARGYQQFSADAHLSKRLRHSIPQPSDTQVTCPATRALIDAVAALARTPESYHQASLHPLQTQGFDQAAMLAVILLAALMAWENRLMLMLGDYHATAGE